MKKWTMNDILGKNLTVTGGAGKIISPDVPEAKKKKPSKYNNKKQIIDGILWDSTKEYNRWMDLKLLLKIGTIQNLERQIRYDFITNKVLLCWYKADFVYEMNGQKVVEDVKGFKTAMYKLKKKMMKAYYGIEIKET